MLEVFKSWNTNLLVKESLQILNDLDIIPPTYGVRVEDIKDKILLDSVFNNKNNSSKNAFLNIDVVEKIVNSQNKYIFSQHIEKHQDLSYPRYTLLLPLKVKDCNLGTYMQIEQQEELKSSSYTGLIKSIYKPKSIRNRLCLLDSHRPHELIPNNLRSLDKTIFIARIWEIEEKDKDNFLLQFEKELFYTNI